MLVKAGKLRSWIGTWDWDILAITETWLRKGQDLQLNVPWYKCHRRDRDGGKCGGMYLGYLGRIEK